MLLLFSIPYVSSGENLLENSDFETLTPDGVPAGWKIVPYKKEIPAAWEISKEAQSGKNAVLFKSIGQLEQYVTVPGTGQYKMSVMIKKNISTPLIMGACFLNHSGWINGVSQKNGIGAGKPFMTWTEVSHIFEVPPGNMKIRIFINGNENVIFDKLTLEKVTIPTDGDLVLSDKLSALETDWEIVSGSWKCMDGALKGMGPNAFIRCRKPVGKNIRAEYTCWSERPCDLSAVAGYKVLPDGNKSLNGYLFGFGSRDNTMNAILRMTAPKKSTVIETTMLGRTLMEGFNTGIEAGKKHKIIIENRDGVLSINRDGKIELVAEDMFPNDVDGEYFGFYVYSEGFFSDLKIFKLPENKNKDAENEVPVQEQIYCGFDNYELPAESSGISVVNFPNWGYKENNTSFKMMDDNALSLNPAPAGKSFVNISLPKTKTGIVEFDILIEKPGNETKIILQGIDNKILASISIDQGGKLFSDGKKGIKELLKYIEYRRRDNYRDEFKLIPNMWYTLRLKYDSEAAGLNAALINLYTEDRTRHMRSSVDQGDYLSLDNFITFKTTLPAAKLSISSTGPGRVLLDNVTALGPVGTRSVNGKFILLSTRALLDLKYEQRRDPMNLKFQSLRNFAPWPLPGFFYLYADNRGKRSFQDAGKEYDAILVRQSFLREKIDHIERLAAYRKDKGQNTESILFNISSLQNMLMNAELKNEEALVALGNSFRNELSDDLLEKKYKPAFTRWKSSIDSLEQNIEEIIRMLAREENNASPAPIPMSFSNGKYQYDFNRKLWIRDGKIEHYFHTWNSFRKWRENLLGFPAHWINLETFIFGTRIEEGEFLDKNAIKRNIEFANANIKEQGDSQDCFFWMHNGTHFCLQPVPDWYDRKYAKNDNDFYFCRQDGKAFAKIAGHRAGMMKNASANFWNPRVKMLQNLRNNEIGKTVRDNPVFGTPTLILMGGEAFNMLDENQETGHNPSAVAAFRAVLMNKYKTIDELNRKWECRYQDFNAIMPPPGRTIPSPLQYEFQKFRQIEYFTEFINHGTNALEQGYGKKLPAGLDIQYTFGAAYFDMAEFFDRVPVVLFHTYKMWDRKIYPRWLNCLSEASGTPWGAHEWVSGQGSKTMYDMEWLRKHSMREISHQIMWRNAAPNKFGNDRSFPCNWQYSLPEADHRLNSIVLNYHSTFWPVMKDRSLRFGMPALTAPLLPPDIALLEITSSWLNEAPTHALRPLMQSISTDLEMKNLNYGFLYEKYLLDGRQKTDGIQTIIIPNGICAPAALDAILEKFVKNGGTVIAFAPPCIFDEYGKPRTGFMAKAFPDAAWTHTNFAVWNAGKNVKANNDMFYQTSWGKGNIVIFRSVIDWKKTQADFHDIIKKYTRETIGSTQSDFVYCLREGNGKKYLYVLNYSAEKRQSGEIYLAGNYNAIDVGMQFPVKLKNFGNKEESRFRLNLAPAEMTLLELTRDKTMK